MMKKVSGRSMAWFAFLLVLLYLGYRMYDSRNYAAMLRETTLNAIAPPVAIISPKPVSATESITLPGTFQGWYEATSYARVTGYVKMWHKKYGDWVKKGDILADISTPDLDAQYQQAIKDLDAERAKYRLAAVTAQRWIALRHNHAVTEQSITVKEQELRAQAAVVEAAHQQVRNIEAFIGFKKIIAPFDGVVLQRNINVGDLVSKQGTLHSPNAKTNLYTVAVIDRLRLFIKVPAYFGPFLRPSLTADVTVPQLPNRHWTAKFLTVSRGFDVATRTATVVFTIENEDHALWPGSYAIVHLTAPVDRPTFVIPTSALVYEKDDAVQAAVLTEDNRVHLKPITVNNLMDSAVEVSAGLSASDRLINNPLHTLLEGDAVRIVTPRPGYDLVTPEEPEVRPGHDLATTEAPESKPSS
ncbi:MAG: efflux RND transporter periplasmic adaptor subunit [Nitrospira sp.]|nr:efflux RND transporter periplasmic adaptor subunit [Nitrospira sp.]